MRQSNRFGKFISLTPAERWLLVQAIAMLPLTALGLRVFGFRRWYAILDRFAIGQDMQSENEIRLVRQIPQFMNIALRHGYYKGNCLSRSLTLWWLLRRQGIQGDLCIGVHKTDEFRAHAWVEYQGCVLNDRSDVRQRFVTFDRAIVPEGFCKNS